MHDAGQRSHTYILDAHGRPQERPFEEWSRWMHEHREELGVARDRDESGATEIEVSTMFFGIDISGGRSARPLLWETMVFGGPLSGRQWRYSSRDEALTGHQDVCQLVRERR